MNHKLVFVSNFMNHHQLPLAQEFARIYGEGYTFIAMEPFAQDKVSVGYRDMNHEPFVLRAYESEESRREAQTLINESECLIAGGVPVSVITSRLKLGKLTFMYSERFFKGPVLKDIVRFLKYSLYSGGRAYARDPDSKFYLLCAGGFAAHDYQTCGLFRNKAYKWGYFTECRTHDVDSLIARKEPGSLLWAGRLLDWKHPELAVMLAKNLKSQGLTFRLRVIGSGPMHDVLAGMVASMGVSDCVEMIPPMPTDELRGEMEKAQVFLFTSDRGEGWGAVLNESMNSACAVFAREHIGSARYLVKDGMNGVIFRDVSDLTQKVGKILRDTERMSTLGREAYSTLNTVWNAKEAAHRFVSLASALEGSREPVSLFESGPCSLAPSV